MSDLFDNPEALVRLLDEIEDSRECEEVGEAELGWPAGTLWLVGPRPVCTCAPGAEIVPEVGHSGTCAMYP